MTEQNANSSYEDDPEMLTRCDLLLAAAAMKPSHPRFGPRAPDTADGRSFTFMSLFAPLDSTVLLIAQVRACAERLRFLFTGLRRYTISKQRVFGKALAHQLQPLLLNVPVLWVVFSAAQELTISQRWPVVSGLLVDVVTTMITIPIADVFERAIERPTNALGKRLAMKYRRSEKAAAERNIW